MTRSPSRRAAALLVAVAQVLARLAGAAVVVIAAVEAVLLVVRPESGPLAVLDILTPHLALLALALTPIWLARRIRTTAVGIAVLVLVVGLRFGGTWLSMPVATAQAGDTDRIEVATWNLQVFSRPGPESAAFLRSTTAEIVALQELQPNAAAAIGADPALRERFPYRVLSPRTDVLGLGILSRYPIVEDAFHLGPAVQTARILLASGRAINVINTHPMHGFIATTGGIPIGFDVTQRNEDLGTIRALFDRLAGGGTPVILLGDLNTADTEPAFARFVAGLRDAHAEVGFGPGWSWRPSRLEFLGTGLVRIDHVITTPAIQSLSEGETCPPVGDHCLVHAALALAAPNP